MTFIIAIHLNDSIIVAADNKEVVLRKGAKVPYQEDFISKIHAWEKGIITGTGESNLINISVELFKQLDGLNINDLPKYLEVSRHIREIELGTEYFQVQTTKLICSSYSEHGAQLYKIERMDGKQSYTMTAIEPMDMTVWMFNPNVETITADLKKLYLDLKDYSAFANQTDWMNHYINRIAPIYQKQSQVDSLMSQSFDIFFQSKDEYVFGHVPNTQNTVLEFKEISADLQSI